MCGKIIKMVMNKCGISCGNSSSRFEYLVRWNNFNSHVNHLKHGRARVYCRPGCRSYGPNNQQIRIVELDYYNRI